MEIVSIGIPTDILRHVCTQFSTNTELAAKYASHLCRPRPSHPRIVTFSLHRFGLTSKLWYREVWRWQTHLCAATSACALSLSKRKNIIDSRIESLSFTAGRSADSGRAPFLERFLVGGAASLRSITIGQDSPDEGRSISVETLGKIPAGVKMLEWAGTGYLSDTARHSVFGRTWISALPFLAFKTALRYLRLDFPDKAAASFLLEMRSNTFPCLETIEMPQALTSETDTVRLASTLSTAIVLDTPLLSSAQLPCSANYENAILQFPSLRILVLSDSDPLVQLPYKFCGTRYIPQRLELGVVQFEKFTREVSQTLKSFPNVLAKLCGRSAGSFSAMALRFGYNFKGVETLIRMEWPLQVGARHSVPGQILSDFHRGVISTSEISKILQPLFSDSSKSLVDIRATFELKNMSLELNPLQMAILSGDEAVFFSVLAASADLENRDLHELVSSRGRVNLFHAAIAMFPSEERALAAMKLAFSRQKQLGLYTSLCYAESNQGFNGLPMTVIESAGMRRFDQVVKFLADKGVEIHPKLLIRSSHAPRSLLHCVHYQSSSVPFSPRFEKLLLGLSECFTNEMLGSLCGTVTLFAKIVSHSSLAVFQRALAATSQELKDTALKQLSNMTTVNPSHERLLLAAGADPLAAGPDGQNCLMLAARKCPERALLMINAKGSSIIGHKDSDGYYAAHFAAEAIYNLRHDTTASAAQVAGASLKALLSPALVKADRASLRTVLDRVDRVVAKLAYFTHLGAREEIVKTRDEVERLFKNR